MWLNWSHSGKTSRWGGRKVKGLAHVGFCRLLMDLGFSGWKGEALRVLNRGMTWSDLQLKGTTLAAVLGIDYKTASLETGKTIKIIQAWGGGGSRKGDNSGDGEQWLDSGYALKAETTGFPDRLDVESEGEKRGIKTSSKFFSHVWLEEWLWVFGR